MIVGKSDISVCEIEKHMSSVEEFIKYADSLVPEEFRHINGIISNQRYICCLALRNSKLIDWNEKNNMLTTILRGVSIVGYTDTIVEVGTIMNLVDIERMEGFRRKR